MSIKNLAEEILDTWEEMFFELKKTDARLSKIYNDKPNIDKGFLRIINKATYGKPISHQEALKLLLSEEPDEVDVEEDPEEICKGLDPLDMAAGQKFELERNPVMGAFQGRIAGAEKDEPDKHIDRQFLDPAERITKNFARYDLYEKQQNKA